MLHVLVRKERAIYPRMYTDTSIATKNTSSAIRPARVGGRGGLSPNRLRPSLVLAGPRNHRSCFDWFFFCILFARKLKMCRTGRL